MRRALATFSAALMTVALVAAPAAAQEKTAKGKITALDGASITVDAKGQPMTFVVDAATTTVIATGAGTVAREAAKTTGDKPKLTDVLKMGDNVEIAYTEAGGKMTAKTIRKIAAVPDAAAAAAAPKRLEGVVSEVSGSSISVKPATGDAMTFMVDAKVRVTGAGLGTMSREKQATGAAVTLTDAVAAGDTVEVTYSASGDMKHATAVRVIKKAAKK
jgi:hypothetical protein